MSNPPTRHATAILLVGREKLLEAWQGRYLLLVLALAVCAGLLAAFLGEVAITETQATRASIAGGFLRMACVLSLGLFVINSMAREFNDNTVLLYLSMPISRGTYLFGKLVGFAAVASVSALICALTLGLIGQWEPALLWAVSLFCEALVVISFGLLCAISLRQVPLAFAALTGFYLLSRSIDALQRIGAELLKWDSSPGQQLMLAVLHGLGYLMPSLDRFASSEWLIHPVADYANLVPIVVQTLIYSGLLLVVALIDLQRRNF